MPKCKNIECKKQFEKKRSNQLVCSPQCAYAYQKQQRDKKAKRDKEALKKTEENIYVENRLGDLQTEINKLSKMIDVHCGYYGCIDCGKTINMAHAAHFHNRGAIGSIRFNLHNLHTARAHCNQFNSEHKVGYREGLKTRYSEAYLDYVENKMPIQFTYLGLSKVDIKEALKITRKCIREFEQEVKKSLKDGIYLRDYFNQKIGLYDYSVYIAIN